MKKIFMNVLMLTSSSQIFGAALDINSLKAESAQLDAELKHEKQQLAKLPQRISAKERKKAVLDAQIANAERNRVRYSDLEDLDREPRRLTNPKANNNGYQQTRRNQQRYAEKGSAY